MQTTNHTDRPIIPEAYHISKEQGYLQVLKGLASYHMRMTTGLIVAPDGSDCCAASCSYASHDLYLDAILFAVQCVEEHMSKDSLPTEQAPCRLSPCTDHILRRDENHCHSHQMQESTLP